MRSRNLKRRSGFRAHILKAQIATVPEHSIGERKWPVRQLQGIVEDFGIGGEQVFVPVIIKVEYADSPRGQPTGRGCETGHGGDILKLTVSQILVEWKAFSEHGCFENVGPAVVVDVAKIRTHTRDRVAESVVGHACL